MSVDPLPLGLKKLYFSCSEKKLATGKRKAAIYILRSFHLFCGFKAVYAMYGFQMHLTGTADRRKKAFKSKRGHFQKTLQLLFEENLSLMEYPKLDGKLFGLIN